MNLSKSKYCNGIQCKKMLWLDKYKPEEKEEINNQVVFDNGNDVHELARKLLGEDINISFNEDLSQMMMLLSDFCPQGVLLEKTGCFETKVNVKKVFEKIDSKYPNQNKP